MKKMKGYEGMEIFVPTKQEVLKALKGEGTPKEKYEIYKNLATSIHHGSTRSKKLTDPLVKYRNELEEVVAEEFRKEGYEVQTQKTMRENMHMKTDEHLFFFFDVKIGEINRVEGNNISIEDYVFDKYGRIKSFSQFKSDYYEKNPVEHLHIQDLDNETDDTKKMLEEFMAEEGICFQDIKSIEEADFGIGLKINCFNKEFEIHMTEKECEEQAKEYLTDGEIWKMEVEAGRTTEGLEEWAESVLNIDGWEHEMCRYDGSSNTTKSGFVYWRTN